AVDALADRGEVAVDRQEVGVVAAARGGVPRRGRGEGEQGEPRARPLERLGEGDRRALEVSDGAGVGDRAGEVEDEGDVDTRLAGRRQLRVVPGDLPAPARDVAGLVSAAGHEVGAGAVGVPGAELRSGAEPVGGGLLAVRGTGDERGVGVPAARSGLLDHPELAVTVLACRGDHTPVPTDNEPKNTLADALLRLRDREAAVAGAVRDARRPVRVDRRCRAGLAALVEPEGHAVQPSDAGAAGTVAADLDRDDRARAPGAGD